MPKCTDGTVEFGRVGRRVVEAAFDGGDIVSDGGVLLLRRVDERLGLTRAAALALGDERRAASVQHDLRSLLAQRIFGLCLDWTDVCDHNALRNDLVMQTAVGRAEPLGSAPTRSRLETAAKPAHAAALHEVLMQQFIASHDKAPKELVLDVDATHVPLRRAWPKTKIIVRADSGFCRPRVLQRLERWRVNCIIGLQKNSRLNEQVALAELALAEQYAAKQTKQRMFGEFQYAAGTWDKARRVIARLEHGEQGANPRFIVTDLPGSPKALYERRYCARGEAENRIKEAQLDLFGRRASCHRFQSNQLRLLLAALAYTLMINLRRLGLQGTELAQACTATLRTKLLKIGAAVLRNTRRVRVLLASAHPMKHVFLAAARALGP